MINGTDDRPATGSFLTEDPMTWVARHRWLNVQVTDGLPDDEMGGYVMSRDTILLADDLTLAEQRSTLAHELVHRLFGDRPDAPDIDAREERCRAVAARLLVPAEALARALEPHLGDVAAQLGVDETTVLDRLRTLSPAECAVVAGAA